MSCSIAMAASSPVLSPSRIPLTGKMSTEALSLVLAISDGSSSPSSPFRPRLQRAPSGLRASSFRKEEITAAAAAAVASDASVASFDPCSTSGSSSSAMGSMKRKRPARIDIPMLPAMSFAAMGEEKGREVVQVDSARFSVYCKRGRTRKEMEDRYLADVDVDGNSQVAFFGVFDGHGGARAAEFVSKNISKHVMEEVAKIGDDPNGIHEAVRAGYLKTDCGLLGGDVTGGACSVTALIRGDDLIVSNAGDCRAVLSRGGGAEAMTSDHRPSRVDERDRVERLGGYVDCYRGVWRLQGSLAVSRGFGDAHLKQWVIAEPETRVIKLNTDCEFLILASDGLWDKVSNQEAVDVARPMCVDSGNASLLSACKKLAELSVSRGSADDVGVMIIQLGRFLSETGV